MKPVIHFTVQPLALLFVIICFPLITFAQNDRQPVKSDSSLILRPDMDSTSLAGNIENIKVDSSMINRPKTATFYAAALPGLGQIYNRDYWKLPILYGTAMVIGYYISWNNNKYHQYLNALFDKQNGITTNPLANQARSVDRIKQGVDYYRRNRDYDMILMAGLYLMQIVDAQVKAQLMDFNISGDLSLRLQPVIHDNPLVSNNIGMGIVLTFN